MNSPLWSVLAIVCFWGWVGSCIGLLACSFPSDGSFRGRQFLLWGLVVLLFAAGWFTGLLKA